MSQIIISRLEEEESDDAKDIFDKLNEKLEEVFVELY